MLAKIREARKPAALVVALAAALAAQWAGLDIGLDPAEVWGLLGAAVLVYVVPNDDPPA